MAKRKSLITIFSVLMVMCAIMLAFSIKPTVNAAISYDASTSTFNYKYEGGTDWVARDISVSDAWAAKNGDELVKYDWSGDGTNMKQVYDLTNAKAITFTVNNANNAKFVYELGIYDTTFRKAGGATDNSNQWLSSNFGSSLYIPEVGQAFWDSSNIVPANFKGRIVLPLLTIQTSANLASSSTNSGNLKTWSAHQNPVFKIRTSKSTSGLFDKAGVQHTFPSATMLAPSIFVYEPNQTGITETISFNNIDFIDATAYDNYLLELDKIDAQQLKTQVANISMENAVLFKVPQYATITYKQNSIANNGNGLTSITNACALAIRIKNTGNDSTHFNFQINEISGETLALSGNVEGKRYLFIHADGTEDFVCRWGDGVVVPAGYDGTMFITLSDIELAGVNNYGCLNGRWSNNTWLINFFNYKAGEFAFGQIGVVKFTNGVNGATYTLEEIKATNTSGTVYNTKNHASYGGGATLSTLTSKTVNITETTDGVISNNASVSATVVNYSDESVLTVPKLANTNVSATLNGQGIELTDNGENYTYTYANTENVAGEVNFAVEYKTTYVVTYVDGNGQTQTLNSVDGKVTLPTLTNAEADVFVGYKVGDKIYKAGEIEVTEAMDLTPVFVDMDMIKGASIRFSNPTGIRFAATINNADIEALGSAVSMGMVITRTIGDEVKYLDAVANNTYAVDDNTTGFNVVVSNISDFDAIYEAKAYVIVNYANGGLTRVLANANDNTRSVKQVAQAVLDAEGSKLPQNYLDILNGFIGA